LIVDTKGKIVFKGHPANRKDLAQDFNDLLEGKELEGVEGPKEEGEGEAEKATGGASIEDIKAAMDEMNKF